MKQTLSKSNFISAFQNYDRYDQFGYEALSILFDYLEELERDMGEEIELDVIALCCDYSVDTVEEIADNYSLKAEDDEDLREVVEDYLRDNTSVIGELSDGRILYMSAF